MTEEEVKTVGFTLPVSLDARLEDLVHAGVRTSKSEFVKEAIENYLDKHLTESEKESIRERAKNMIKNTKS